MATLNRVGETRIVNNGMKLTIIAYRSCNDIDIQFEDGTIVQHVRYDKFKSGCVRHPLYYASTLLARDKHVGETNRATNGMLMTIIEYRASKDIDIKFEDGAIVEHRCYSAFRRGQIGYPVKHKSQRIGEIHTVWNGQKLKIIDYINSDNVTGQFEDGTVVEHLNYFNICRGAVKNPNYLKNSRVGTSIRANNGQLMTIIAYRKEFDIDVQFEDGTIVQGVRYSAFKRGEVANPTIQITRDNVKSVRLGKSVIHPNGLQMTIIEYISAADMTVRFEDGHTVKHVRYASFMQGSVHYPGFSRRIQWCEQRYVGKAFKATNGQLMTIIAYRRTNDIDVQFEDGTVVTTTYTDFKEGNVRNPMLRKGRFEYRSDRIGVTITNTQGISAKVVEYNTSKDFKVMFETGCELIYQSYARFYSGLVRHPFPYDLGVITIEKPAYVLGTTGNFYCKCSKCGIRDIMTIPEMKLHKCIAK